MEIYFSDFVVLGFNLNLKMKCVAVWWQCLWICK